MRLVTLALAGDVMTGRGVDQILGQPSDPVLYEDWIRSAVDYVRLAERVSGPLPRRAPPEWVWGDALPALRRADARIVNLETAVTTSSAPFPKGIHYRMHPANVGVLTVAGVDVCGLANNHVLDWECDGLRETLATLRGAGLRTAGAGLDDAEARAPAVVPVPGGRVLVYAFGHPSSGIPTSWAAGPGRPGVALIDLTGATAREIGRRIARDRRPGDLVVASIHWGGNWGWSVPAGHRRFARALVEEAGVHVVHGHSSHHPMGVELVRGRPILYGAGDLLNDYEGISGYEAYRPELTVLWMPTLDADTGALARLELVPLRVRRFRLERATAEEAAWLARTLDRESAGVEIAVGDDGLLRAHGRSSSL